VEGLKESVVGRDSELAAGDSFLQRVPDGAVALVLEGEAGIGKTTIWSELVDRAGARSYRVLRCRPAEAEARLSYAGLTDLLSPVEGRAFASLPDPQRRAVDAVLLRADPAGDAVDQRAVCAATAALLAACAAERPTVVAVDDVQWLDAPSARVVAYALRRVAPLPIGFLFTVRGSGSLPVPLGLDRALDAARVSHLTLSPLSLGALRELLSRRLDFLPSRPLLLRIQRESGGNPFFAIEMARAVAGAGDELPPEAGLLPENLGSLVRERIEKLPRRTREALLLVSVLADPTLAVLERVGQKEGALAPARAAGVIVTRDGRICFTHPLLGSAAYASVSERRRRELHRQLGAVLGDTEERALHLALAAEGPDERVAATLERAATQARTRGASDSAAELSAQALALTPANGRLQMQRRRLTAAEDHFYAGDRRRARGLLEPLLGEQTRPPLRADALCLAAELHYYDDSWPDAVPLLREALALAASDGRRRVRIALDLSYVLFNTGDVLAAEQQLGAVFDDALALEDPARLAKALGMKVGLDLVLGRGVDHVALHRALALEDWDRRTMLPLRPTWAALQAALFTGQLQDAHSICAELRENLARRGLDADLPATAGIATWVECWRGDLTRADRISEEAVLGSLELESRTSRVLALSARALARAYLGDIAGAQRDGEDAVAISEQIGWSLGRTMAFWPLGFLALSTDNEAEADRLLAPLADASAAVGLPEPAMAPFLPDEIEALIHLGDLDTARRLIDLLESRGRALDRAWALATAARCRGLLRAAEGDVSGALGPLDHALAQHDRISMPIELGRTLLVLGQIQRRLRLKRGAKDSFERASDLFRQAGARLWSAKAADEIGRIGLRRPASDRGAGEMTETEQKVAMLATSGLTNKQIAAQLFISPKTVEANLGKVYAKLGVHSRAQLGARMTEKGASPLASASLTEEK
jgi:DNA-binding CsgD family transcriptional regulator